MIQLEVIDEQGLQSKVTISAFRVESIRLDVWSSDPIVKMASGDELTVKNFSYDELIEWWDSETKIEIIDDDEDDWNNDWSG